MFNVTKSIKIYVINMNPPEYEKLFDCYYTEGYMIYLTAPYELIHKLFTKMLNTICFNKMLEYFSINL